MKKYIIVLATILFSISCGNKDKTTKTEAKPTPILKTLVQLTDQELKNIDLESSSLEKKIISAQLKVNGIIDVPPQNLVSISVPLGGFLKSSKLLPGMQIAKGEILATLEDQQYIQLQQDYLTAISNLKFIQADFERQKKLNESKANSDKTFQQVENDFANQKILLKSMQEKLKLIGINPASLNENNISRSIYIHSPINGYVSSVNANIGKYINPTDVLFELVNPDDIHLGLTIFEKDLDKIFIGQKLMAFTNNNEKKYPCQIILIGKKLSVDRCVEVHCHFDSYDKTLIPGMFMNATIDVKSDNVFVLPDEAIVQFENKNYAFLMKNKNSFEMIEIKSGKAENGFVEISINEKYKKSNFVKKGAYTLLMKLKNTEE
jgi:cobalt-zinc-cadmium efflux system membrane fusion protein